MIFTKCLWDLRKNNSFLCKCVKEALEKSVLMLQVEQKFTCLEKREGHFKLRKSHAQRCKDREKMEGKARTPNPMCWPWRVFRESGELSLVGKKNRVTKGLISSCKQSGLLLYVLCTQRERGWKPIVRCYFILFYFYLFIFTERGREGKREGEKHPCVGASHMPHTEDLPGLQPRHAPWLEIEPETLWFTAHTQSTELHQPGQWNAILNPWLSFWFYLIQYEVRIWLQVREIC